MKHKKPLLISGAVIILLVLAGVGYLLVMSRATPAKDVSSNEGNQTTASTGYSKEQQAAFVAYDGLINSGKYDEAEAYVKTMPISDGMRAGFLRDIATLKDRFSKLPEYLDKEKDGTWTYQDALDIATIYKREGKSDEAKSYYEKAKVLVYQSDSPMKEDTIKSIEESEADV